MWNYVVIEIEKTLYFVNHVFTLRENIQNEDIDKVVMQHIPCWNILYKAPIEDRCVDDEELEARFFTGCQVWLEQNKVEGSKYAILKMYIS